MSAVMKVAVALVVFVAVAESAPREKRQTFQQQYPYQQQQQYQPQYQQQTFQCPSASGQFAYTADCAKFYQCDNGVATVTNCQSQLVFNPQTGYCDWPANVPSCANQGTTTQQMFKPQFANLCTQNPYGGNPGETFLVRHPEYCNAFFTCTEGFMHGLCTFCAKGEYFNKLAGGCRQFPEGLLNTSPLCESSSMIAHNQTTRYTIGDSCWPFANLANPWAALALKLEQDQQQQQYQQQPY